MDEFLKQFGPMIGFGIMAVPFAVVVGLFLKYGGSPDPVHQVYDRCIERHHSLSANADLARRIERVCHVEQAAAYEAARG